MKPERQTLETVRADFDRIALLENDAWDHNSHYHAFLLGKLPIRCEMALEVGCGTGKFTRLLAARCRSVTAIDLSPEMIRLARDRSPEHDNIDFVVGDVMSCDFPDDTFGCVGTLTTLHHLPIEEFLRKVSAILKPGGVFVCLDIYGKSGMSDLLLLLAAVPASALLRRIRTGHLRAGPELQAAYAEHGKTDTYPALSDIQQMCTQILPGAIVKKHLFWRYSIVWQKQSR